MLLIEEVANCVPAFTPLVAKCYGTRPADLFFRTDPRETRTIACSSGVRQGDPIGPAMFCLAMRPGLKRFRQEFERETVEAFAYMDDVFLGLTGITANAVRVFAFLRRELDDICIVVKDAKTVVLSPKGHAPTVEEISLLKRVQVRIADEGGGTVVGVPIGTEEYVRGREMEVVRDEGVGRLARCLANMPDKQAAILIGVEYLGKRTSYLERALDPRLSLEACKRADSGAQWAYEKTLELPGAAEAQSFFQEGCPDSRLTFKPYQQAQARLSMGAGGLGLPSIEAFENGGIHWEHGEDPAGGPSRPVRQ